MERERQGVARGEVDPAGGAGDFLIQRLELEPAASGVADSSEIPVFEYRVFRIDAGHGDDRAVEHDRQTVGTLSVDAAGRVQFDPTTSPQDPFDLGFVRRVFGLSYEELADLFGIRRSSLVGWQQHGIPLNRRATVARLVELARVLARDVREERLPEIVRTPDAWLDGKTILQTIRESGVEPVFAYLHRLFAYA